MPEDRPVELPDFATYYDASLPNWFAIGITAIVVTLVVGLVVGLVVAVRRKTK